MESIHDLADYFIEDEIQEKYYFLYNKNFIDCSDSDDMCDEEDDVEKNNDKKKIQKLSHFDLMLEYMSESLNIKMLLIKNELTVEKLNKYSDLTLKLLIWLLASTTQKMHTLQKNNFMLEIDYIYEKKQHNEFRNKMYNKQLTSFSLYNNLVKAYNKLKNESEEAIRFYNFHLQNNIINY